MQKITHHLKMRLTIVTAVLPLSCAGAVFGLVGRECD